MFCNISFPEMEHAQVEVDNGDDDEEEEEEEEDGDDMEEGEAEMEILHESGVSAHSMIDAIMDEVSSHVFHDQNDNETPESEEGIIFTGTIPEGSDSPMKDLPSTSEGASAKASSSSSSSPPKSPPVKTLLINESILTLLLKLYTKLSERNANYLLPNMRSEPVRQEGQPFVGGGVGYICCFLDRVAGMHDGVRTCLEDHSRKHMPSGSGSSKSVASTSDGDSMEDR